MTVVYVQWVRDFPGEDCLLCRWGMSPLGNNSSGMSNCPIVHHCQGNGLKLLEGQHEARGWVRKFKIAIVNGLIPNLNSKLEKGPYLFRAHIEFGLKTLNDGISLKKWAVSLGLGSAGWPSKDDNTLPSPNSNPDDQIYSPFRKTSLGLYKSLSQLRVEYS